MQSFVIRFYNNELSEVEDDHPMEDGSKFNFHPSSQARFFIQPTRNLSSPPALGWSPHTTGPSSNILTPAEIESERFGHPATSTRQLSDINQSELDSALQRHLPSSASTLYSRKQPSNDIPMIVEVPATPEMRSTKYPPAVNDNPHVILITEHICNGDLWTFWRGHNPLLGNVLLKTVNMEYCPYDNGPEGRWFTPASILKDVIQEEKIHFENLYSLQGKVVPKYYGFYQSDSHLAVLMEFCGVPFGYHGYFELNDHWLEKIYEVYRQIHLRGIWHGDVDSDHLLVDNHMQVRLVGLRKAEQVNMTKVEDVCMLIQEAFWLRVQLTGDKTPDFHPLTHAREYMSQLSASDIKLLEDRCMNAES